MRTSHASSLAIIRKRNGSSVPFEVEKITRAVEKACAAAGVEDGDLPERITAAVIEELRRRSDGDSTFTPAVEDVQDLVEKHLVLKRQYPVAKTYMLYREQHAILRRMSEEGPLSLVGKYLGESDWRVRENSNMAYSLQGLNNYVASDISRRYWLEHVYDKRVREAPHETMPATILLRSDRTLGDAMFEDELSRMERTLPLLVEHYLTREAEVPRGFLRGRIGREHLISVLERQPGSHVFVCGSIPFVRDMRILLKEVGAPEDSIFTEAFF